MTRDALLARIVELLAMKAWIEDLLPTSYRDAVSWNTCNREITRFRHHVEKLSDETSAAGR